MDKKMIRLVPQTAYLNHMKVDVFDSKESDFDRLRCTIDVEYSDYDLKELKKAIDAQGKPYNMANIREYYHNWMHALLKQLLSSDWDGGESETTILDIIEQQIKSNSELEL